MIIQMMPHIPIEKFKHIKQTRDTIIAIAAEVMTEKQNDMRKGLDGGKDLMSLLLRANAEEDTHRRMSDEEIIAGITYVRHFKGFLSATHTRVRSTITLAGCRFRMPAKNHSYLTALSHRHDHRNHSLLHSLGASQES